MTFYELYLNDSDLFVKAITENANLYLLARLLDECRVDNLQRAYHSETPAEKVVAQLKIPLLDAIDEYEADTGKEPASQAADDVLAQSRRQDGKA